MSKLLRFSAFVISMMLSASMVQAAGLNLAWTDCLADGGTSNRTFACASNTGSNALFGSFIPPSGITAMTGAEVVLDLLTQDVGFTNWWRMFTAGSCRAASLSANFLPGPAGGAGVCQDYWQGQASGAIAAYTVGQGGMANRARILLVGATAPSNAVAVDPNLEYYAFTVSINNQKSVGTGACTGCLDKVCIVLNSIIITQPAGTGDFFIGNAATSQIVTWQGEDAATCLPVPTRNRTWGSVKALYR